jgi:hypothetical protein
VDFQKLISDTEKGYRPYYTYSDHGDEALITFYSVFTVWGHLIVCRILSTKGLAPFTSDTARRTCSIVSNLSAEILAWLHSIYADTRPLQAMVCLKRDRENILLELDRRHCSLKAGRAFIAQEEGAWLPKGLSDYHKLLEIEKLQSYSPAERDDATADLRSEATTRAVEFFTRRGETIKVRERPGMPLPVMPTEWGVPPPNQPRWEVWHREMLSLFIEALCQDYLSLFVGGVDRVKEFARQHLRNEWKTRDRRKTIMEGTEKFPKKRGPDLTRAEWDFSETSAKRRREEIAEEIQARLPNPEEYLQRAQDEQEELRNVAATYEYAQSRWGKEEGQKFIDTIKEGGTTKEAAQAIGISREMGHRYKKELKTALSKKNPQK